MRSTTLYLVLFMNVLLAAAAPVPVGPIIPEGDVISVPVGSGTFKGNEGDSPVDIHDNTVFSGNELETLKASDNNVLPIEDGNVVVPVGSTREFGSENPESEGKHRSGRKRSASLFSSLSSFGGSTPPNLSLTGAGSVQAGAGEEEDDDTSARVLDWLNGVKPSSVNPEAEGKHGGRRKRSASLASDLAPLLQALAPTLQGLGDGSQHVGAKGSVKVDGNSDVMGGQGSVCRFPEGVDVGLHAGAGVHSSISRDGSNRLDGVTSPSEKQKPGSKREQHRQGRKRSASLASDLAPVLAFLSPTLSGVDVGLNADAGVHSSASKNRPKRLNGVTSPSENSEPKREKRREGRKRSPSLASDIFPVLEAVSPTTSGLTDGLVKTSIDNELARYASDLVAKLVAAVNSASENPGSARRHKRQDPAELEADAHLDILEDADIPVDLPAAKVKRQEVDVDAQVAVDADVAIDPAFTVDKRQVELPPTPLTGLVGLVPINIPIDVVGEAVPGENIDIDGDATVEVSLTKRDVPTETELRSGEVEFFESPDGKPFDYVLRGALCCHNQEAVVRGAKCVPAHCILFVIGIRPDKKMLTTVLEANPADGVMHIAEDLASEEVDPFEKRSEKARRLILDGTVNDADVLSKIDLLNTNINSDINVSENRNANARADGKVSRSILDRSIVDTVDAKAKIEVRNEGVVRRRGATADPLVNMEGIQTLALQLVVFVDVGGSDAPSSKITSPSNERKVELPAPIADVLRATTSSSIVPTSTPIPTLTTSTTSSTTSSTATPTSSMI
ncbi:hypothetical protein ABW19_dt0207889 [Dactylella cylindrospora]|nr:hypothetical protein ABW19_dt0207889 [Dactylella cylindrospora]